MSESTMEEKFKRLAEIDALVRRMRSSSVDKLPESDLIAMMEVAVQALKTPQRGEPAEGKTTSEE